MGETQQPSSSVSSHLDHQERGSEERQSPSSGYSVRRSIASLVISPRGERFGNLTTKAGRSRGGDLGSAGIVIFFDVFRPIRLSIQYHTWRGWWIWIQIALRLRSDISILLFTLASVDFPQPVRLLSERAIFPCCH